MAKIQKLNFDKGSGSVEWHADGQRVQPVGPALEQAIEDPVNDLVFALEKSNGLPRRLHVYAASGKEIAALAPPEGFEFYYLTSYPKLGVAVVCVTPEPVEGWRDWHFGFDPKGKQLFRHAPSY